MPTRKYRYEYQKRSVQRKGEFHGRGRIWTGNAASGVFYFIFLLVKGLLLNGFFKGFGDSNITISRLHPPRHVSGCGVQRLWALMWELWFRKGSSVGPSLFQGQSAPSTASELSAFLPSLPGKMLMSANYNSWRSLFLWWCAHLFFRSWNETNSFHLGHWTSVRW